MNIQFHHKRITKITQFEFDEFRGIEIEISAKGGTTVALQVPTIEEFNNFEILPKDHWGTYPTIELEVGLAKCSDKENYNKKLGRNIAKGRMRTVVFWARKNSEDEVILCDTQGKFPELVLRRSPKGGKVHFVGVGK